jgi:hypothetical protein
MIGFLTGIFARMVLSVVVLFALLFAILSISGCGGTMSTFYKSVGAASTLVATGYRLLDQQDAQTQTAIVAQAKTDPVAAQAALTAYLVKYDLARKALTAASATVQDANNAAPVLELATSGQSTSITTWVLKLATLVADVIASLKPLGVNLTIDGFNVSAALSTIAGVSQ